MPTIHLQPTAPVAERVLLPGDPGRALALAQALLDQPRMLNHHRGLWGYSGTTADGHPLSIQSTGMGGPSAAIVAAELAELGARVMLRVGTCGALTPQAALGDLVIASAALSADGTSRALGAGEQAEPDPALVGCLHRAAASTEAVALHGPVVSTDLFYDHRVLEEEWRRAGAVAVEMESATLFALAARRGFAAASLLVVSDLVSEERVRIEPDALREAELTMGRTALSALALLGDPS